MFLPPLFFRCVHATGQTLGCFHPSLILSSLCRSVSFLTATGSLLLSFFSFCTCEFPPTHECLALLFCPFSVSSPFQMRPLLPILSFFCYRFAWPSIFPSPPGSISGFMSISFFSLFTSLFLPYVLNPCFLPVGSCSSPQFVSLPVSISSPPSTVRLVFCFGFSGSRSFSAKCQQVFVFLCPFFKFCPLWSGPFLTFSTRT